MKVLFLSILLVLGYTVCAQSDKAKENHFKLKGRIINEVELTPGCGYLAFGTVIEFKIISFSDKTHKSNKVGVIIPCPELLGTELFKIGQTVELLLADENQANFEFIIPNKEKLRKYSQNKVYWAYEVNTIETEKK